MKKIFCDFCGKEFNTVGFFVGWTGRYFVKYALSDLKNEDAKDCCEDCFKKLVNGEKTKVEEAKS